MKKRYINPSVTVVTINSELPIADSVMSKGGSTITDGATILSKDRDDDDFDFGGEGGDWSDDLW